MTPEEAPAPVLIWDLESNGLLDSLTEIHCLVIKDTSTGVSSRYNDQPVPVRKDGSIADGVRRLQEATEKGNFIAGHNIIKFDIPAVQKLYPWFKPVRKYVRDTLVLTRLIYTDLIGIDTKLMESGKLPRHLFKAHKLEAWGYRTGTFKDEYEGDPAIPNVEDRKKRKWERWNLTMEDYCVQDVEATEALWNKCWTKIEGPTFRPLKKFPVGFSLLSVELETEVQFIIAQQERNGFSFDKEGASKLYAELVKEKLVIEENLKRVFKPRWFKDGNETIPKVSRRDQEELLGLNYSRPKYEGKGKSKALVGYYHNSWDYTEGCPYQKVKLVSFNPGSRTHIAIWLKALHGWEPAEFTADGSPKVDEEILTALPYPAAKAFIDYLTITKRLGQLAEGNEAWLRHEKNGVIYGQVITNGAVTGRATHSKPNTGQVPGVKKGKDGTVLMGLPGGWGYECRSLWGPRKGLVQVGVDMSGIELRCLAHYMARYDDGAYAKELLTGDIHKANQKAAGLPTRDIAKTFIYAFLYGAGDAKIGSIVGADSTAGGALKTRFLRGVPALSKLIDAIRKASKGKGTLKGLDGRILTIRHSHAALNTLLQSCGAILSKMWMVLFHRRLEEAGLSDQVWQLAWVHDEIQLECLPSIAERVGKMAVEAIEETGRFFNFRVKITGEYKIGANWAECH